MLFQEAKFYLQGIQQLFGNAIQDNYGAGFRINELGGILLREREHHQECMESISRINHQEYFEMQNRADTIREEAQEAGAAKDHQRSHERELITDEVMKLKNMNDRLNRM